MRSSAWTRGDTDIQNDTFPRRKVFQHLSVAQQLFSSFGFCCFDFIYSSVSRIAGFILRRLNLFPITFIPQHKRIHLGHESITEAALLGTLHVFFLILKHSEERPLDWAAGSTKSVLILMCLFPRQRHVGFSNKTGTIILCRPCVCCSAPSNSYGWIVFFKLLWRTQAIVVWGPGLISRSR